MGISVQMEVHVVWLIETRHSVMRLYCFEIFTTLTLFVKKHANAKLCFKQDRNSTVADPELMCCYMLVKN